MDGEEEDADFLPILPQWAPEKQISVNSNSEEKNDESRNERSEAEEEEPTELFSETLIKEPEIEEKDLIEAELNKKNSSNNSDSNELQKNKESEFIAEDSKESLVTEELDSSNQLNEKVPVHEEQKKAFQVHSPKKKSIGKLSNLGKAALDVEETVLGHYKKKVDLAEWVEGVHQLLLWVGCKRPGQKARHRHEQRVRALESQFGYELGCGISSDVFRVGRSRGSGGGEQNDSSEAHPCSCDVWSV